MSNYKNTSPAKKLRAIKRLLTFLSNKSPVKLKDVQKSLTISPQESFSFSPPKLQPNLVASPLSSIDIPPVVKKISNLNIVKSQYISIPPRPVYHPTIINACTAMFAKHPSQLRPHEVEKFNYYRKRKSQIGEPLEQEIIYLPSGGLRTCLNCRELTWRPETLHAVFSSPSHTRGFSLSICLNISKTWMFVWWDFK